MARFKLHTRPPEDPYKVVILFKLKSVSSKSATLIIVTWLFVGFTCFHFAWEAESWLGTLAFFGVVLWSLGLLTDEIVSGIQLYNQKLNRKLDSMTLLLAEVGLGKADSQQLQKLQQEATERLESRKGYGF